MKKAFPLLVILFSLSFWFYSSKGENHASMKFVSNPALPTLLSPEQWQGTPLDAEGKFTNLHQPFETSFGDVLKWQTSKNPQKAEKKLLSSEIKSMRNNLILE